MPKPIGVIGRSDYAPKIGDTEIAKSFRSWFTQVIETEGIVYGPAKSLRGLSLAYVEGCAHGYEAGYLAGLAARVTS